MKSSQLNQYDTYTFVYKNQWKRAKKTLIAWIFLPVVAVSLDYYFNGNFQFIYLFITPFTLIYLMILVRTKIYKKVKVLKYDHGKFFYEDDKYAPTVIKFNASDLDTVQKFIKESMFGGASSGGVYKSGQPIATYRLIFKRLHATRHLCKQIELGDDEFPEVKEIIDYLLETNDSLVIIEVDH